MTTGRINQVAFLLDAGTAQDLDTLVRGLKIKGEHNNRACTLGLGKQRAYAP
jgi:hypothetical protein